VEQALKLSNGLVMFSKVKDKGFEMPEYPKSFDDHLFSETFACPIDNIQIAEIEPRIFSFNSPQGACPTCNGIGYIKKIDPNLVFSEELSLYEGGILAFSTMFEHDTWYSRLITHVCNEEEIDMEASIKSLTQQQKNTLLFGTKNKTYQIKGTNRFGKWTQITEVFTGAVNELERRYKETTSDATRAHIEKYMREEIIEMEAITFMRGRSIANQFVIIDEAQNLTPHEIKTVISRAGNGTKMVLTGDAYQIDNPYLDSSSNGLTYCVEHMKGQDMFGHITLTNSERSPLASLAAELL